MRLLLQMFPFPRNSRDVRPLHPEIEALLRSLPGASPPGDLRVRVLAAHARRTAGAGGRGLWVERLRAGLLSGVVAGGFAVAAFAGWSAWSAPAGDAGSSATVPLMDVRHPMPAVLSAARVIDEPAGGALAFDAVLPMAADAWDGP